MYSEIIINKDITVSVSRSISIGALYRISNSTKLDCSSGLVRIISIGSRDELNTGSCKYDLYSEYDNEDEIPKDWVKFKYEEYENVEDEVADSESNDIKILPVGIFANHISVA